MSAFLDLVRLYIVHCPLPVLHPASFQLLIGIASLLVGVKFLHSILHCSQLSFFGRSLCFVFVVWLGECPCFLYRFVFELCLYLHVNLIKEIRVAITISPSSRFQWESWMITWSCNCCLSLYVFYKFLGEPVMTTQFHQCNPSIIFCVWNDAIRRYPDWILTYRKFTKLVLSTTSSTVPVIIC